MFYLYKITNLINNKIYVGVHRTDNPNDDYMGSGHLILRAINKYGVDNFSKTILASFENREDAYRAEAEIVTPKFLLREDVYNINRGGDGGRYYMNLTKTAEQRTEHSRLGAAAIHSRTIEEKQATFDKISKALTGKKYRKGVKTAPEETSRKRKEKMAGKKLHPVTRKWVSKEDYEAYIASQNSAC